MQIEATESTCTKLQVAVLTTCQCCLYLLLLSDLFSYRPPCHTAVQCEQIRIANTRCARCHDFQVLIVNEDG